MCPPTTDLFYVFLSNCVRKGIGRHVREFEGQEKSTNFFSRVIVYIGSRYRARILKLNVENDWEFNVHLHPNFFGPTSNIRMKKAGFGLARTDTRGGKRKRTVYTLLWSSKFVELSGWTTWSRKYLFNSTDEMLKGEINLETAFPHLWLSLLGPGPQTRVERGSWGRRVAVL